MPASISCSLHPSRRKPLAACIAALFTLSAPAAYATVFVTNCMDNGIGSLRAAAASAANGDTVDMTGLTTGSSGCSNSRITLSTGDIVVNQNNLTIDGPGMANLTISAKYLTQYQNRIFTHNGTGTLTIQNVSLSYGRAYDGAGSARGGCIYSRASVSLYKTAVSSCAAVTTSGTAQGGAVYAHGNLSLKYSTISNNLAYGGSTGLAFGGGLLNAGSFTAKYSTISANTASGSSGHVAGTAGGIYIAGGNSTLIRGTTISGNTADKAIGGIVLLGATGTSATLTNSTISGNTTAGVVGGIYAITPTLNINNSTIVLNTAGAASGISAGVILVAPGGGATVTLQSTLIANNTYGSPATDSDLSTTGPGLMSIGGQNNLIRVSSASLPAGTIVGKCPILGRLRFNGGVTQTHALFSHSPGVDQGNDSASLNQDQQGRPNDVSPYPYPRVSNGVADIGAFELQQTEVIFDANFEGCP